MRSHTHPPFPTGLTRAVRTANYPALERLIARRGADVLRSARRDGNTCLHIAAQRNDPALITWLLARGADPMQANRACNTPLAEAVRSGHLQAAETLLPASPRVSRTGMIELAIRARHEHVASYLVRHHFAGSATPNDSLGHYAVHFDTPETLSALLECGLSRSACGGVGGTLLHTAAEMGRTECARRLLESGFDLERRDRYQRTPLHEAARYARVGILTLLLQAGADCEARDKQGHTVSESIEHHAANAAEARACEELLRGVRRQVALADAAPRPTDDSLGNDGAGPAL